MNQRVRFQDMLTPSASKRRLGVDTALVCGRMVGGDISITDGQIAEVGLPSDGSGYLAVAGYIDLQVNGFAGVDYSRADTAGYLKGGSAMAASGVTTFQPTFVSLPWDRYCSALARAEEAMKITPGMVGVHLEGPFLSPEKHGAHDVANIVAPDPDRVAALATHPAVSWVTLAPEAPGGLEAIRAFTQAGKRVAIGHSNAPAEIARMAFDAGAIAVTHLFNAQSPLHHRAPGIPGAALDHSDVAVTIIVDGHHLAPETVRLVFRTASCRTALISDATMAAGPSKGNGTQLGDREVNVAGNRTFLDDGTLAGSLVGLDEAVCNTIDIGVPVVSALRAATEIPARLLGRPAIGDLAPLSVADVVVLDSDFRVVRTLRAGQEIHHR